MKLKTVVKVVLLIFVSLSAGWLLFQQNHGARESGPLPSSPGRAASPASRSGHAPLPDRVVVYYFHTTYRCPTCYKIENYTREAVESGFAPALKEGRLEFLSLNVEEEGNEHYIKDYRLHAKSVVVSEVKNGKEVRWKNLTRVWQLVRDKEAFFQYIQDEVNAYLQGK